MQVGDLKIEDKALQGLGIALLLCLVLEPYPLYLIGSLRAFELSFLGLGLISVFALIASNRIKVKNRIFALLAYVVAAVLGLFSVGILVCFATGMLSFFILGVLSTSMVQHMIILIFVCLTGSFIASCLVAKNKEQWVVLAGALAPCLITVFCSFLKLHGQG